MTTGALSGPDVTMGSWDASPSGQLVRAGSGRWCSHSDLQGASRDPGLEGHAL